MNIDPTTQQQIIHDLTVKLSALYIFPQVAEQIGFTLQKHLEEGHYADLNEGDIFALALTMHLQEVSHDEHLWVRWHPQPLPEIDDPLRHNQAWQEARKLEAQLENYGFRRAERLPGNVGYLDIRYFHRPTWGGDTASAAMNFVANTFALIIDLRQCTGGYPGMIAMTASYLFGEEALHLDTIEWHDDNVTQQYWTLPYIPGKRYLDKPVYVLIGKETFSGGEEFAYILQTRKRATLIGDRTGGGAHPGASYRIHPYFEVFIPIGRTINPITGTNWEVVGVIPDITIPDPKAFPTTYRLALQSVLSRLGDSPSGPMKELTVEIQAALEGLTSHETT